MAMALFSAVHDLGRQSIIIIIIIILGFNARRSPMSHLFLTR